jgi:hypothetical protein
MVKIQTPIEIRNNLKKLTKKTSLELKIFQSPSPIKNTPAAKAQ